MICRSVFKDINLPLFVHGSCTRQAAEEHGADLKRREVERKTQFFECFQRFLFDFVVKLCFAQFSNRMKGNASYFV